jgi:hypothetical protein
MPSAAFAAWTSGAAVSLGEVVDAHQRLGGTRPGRRALTEINYAYAIRLAAHFQGYARALHSEAAAAIAGGIDDPNLRLVVQTQMTDGRSLDRGNASAANIGADFSRFGFRIWDKVQARHALNARRRQKLDSLLEWRNGIAHDDLERRRADGLLDPERMTMGACQTWRRALHNLIRSLDVVVADRVEILGEPRPW